MTSLSPRSMLTQDDLDETASQAKFSGSYALYMSCAGVLAAVALLSSSVPVLIGSMIVAPLMPPLALVPFALVSGRRAAAWRGLGVAVAGLALAFVAAWLTTAVMSVVGVIPPEMALLDKPLLQERVRPGWWSMAAAAAAGLAGTTAQAHSKTDTIIGTVASLALVPAVGATAIALYVGAPAEAVGGALLLVLNVGLIIGMGIVALLVSAGRDGLRPLALVPVAVVVVVSVLLLWAQSSGAVPETATTIDPFTRTTPTGESQVHPVPGPEASPGAVAPAQPGASDR